ncbi:hypothetical protein MKX01_000941 [Papaver californicum]|nr:hypothetical protein MKX01_000941 [Papaver californicum]
MDELVRRQDEFDQWYLGDFDMYVELFMPSHILQAPIFVFITKSTSGDLKNISNYGQECEENDKPIKVLFHDYGHYDVLEILSGISCCWLRDTLGT